jgi:hypothetical protein
VNQVLPQTLEVESRTKFVEADESVLMGADLELLIPETRPGPVKRLFVESFKVESPDL